MRKKLINKPLSPLVCVEWVDSHYRAGWTIEEAIPKPLTCYSVGWITHKNKDAVVLTSHLSNEESPQRCGDMTIPKRAILTIEKIS